MSRFRLILALAAVSALAACGGSGGVSSTASAGSASTEPGGSVPTGATGNGTPATVVSGDFTLQAGTYYDREAANLAGAADHYNLDVEGDGLHIVGMVATLDPGTTGSHQVCSHTQPQVNLELTVTWPELANKGQYCVSDLGLATISLLTVQDSSASSSVTVHVDTWPCTDEECWTVSGAS